MQEVSEWRAPETRLSVQEMMHTSPRKLRAPKRGSTRDETLWRSSFDTARAGANATGLVPQATRS